MIVRVGGKPPVAEIPTLPSTTVVELEVTEAFAGNCCIAEQIAVAEAEGVFEGNEVPDGGESVNVFA